MDTTFIFYLQLTPRLPKFYLKLAAELNFIGIELIPVGIKDLQHLMGKEKSKVLILNDSIQTNGNYKLLKKKYLDFMLINKRIEIIEVGAFARPIGIGRVESLGLYHFFALPATVTEIAFNVKMTIHGEKEQGKKWPGGRRTTLPSIQ